MCYLYMSRTFFFFNDTATTEIYTLSLHDALPISSPFFGYRRSKTFASGKTTRFAAAPRFGSNIGGLRSTSAFRSEEHTSELQSQSNLVCRLLLEKKKKNEEHVLILYYTRISAIIS